MSIRHKALDRLKQQWTKDTSKKWDYYLIIAYRRRSPLLSVSSLELEIEQSIFLKH